MHLKRKIKEAVEREEPAKRDGFRKKVKKFIKVSEQIKRAHTFNIGFKKAFIKEYFNKYKIEFHDEQPLDDTGSVE